jgi:transcriptional regulator with XRE-family HTH domain
MELGKRTPSLDTLLALSRGLQIPLAEILAIVEARLEEVGSDKRSDAS